MSGTIEVPRGLDKMSPEEERMMASMRDDGPEPEPTPPPAPPAPAAAEEPEIDIPDGPRSAPAAESERGTAVPHAQFHATNERRKAAEKRATEAEAARHAAETKHATELARAQERLDLLIKMAQIPAPEAAPIAPVADEALPDVDTDPIGHFRELSARQSRQVDALTGVVRGLQEGQQQAQRARELQEWGAAQERVFAGTEPSYSEAMAWLTKSRDEELTKLGVTDAAERQRILRSDITAIAARARNDGANFAQRLYDTAQARGWAKKAPEPPAAVAAPAATIPALDSPAVTAALRAAEGRENSLTIGSVGSAPPVRMSVEKIANMPEEQFAVFLKRFEGNPAALRQLMGE